MHIFWFRRDLRLDDNHGLYRALSQGEPVQPIFIFDSDILDHLQPGDRRVEFIASALAAINEQCKQAGGTLWVFYGKPLQVLQELKRKHAITSIACNHDYEPYARQRDEAVHEWARANSIAFTSYKDQVVFERSEVVKPDGLPYTVFTPYSKRWKSQLKPEMLKAFPSESMLDKLHKTTEQHWPQASQVGLSQWPATLPSPPQPAPALLKAYSAQRDFPAVAGTSRISVHLRFGTISIRKLVALAIPQSESWLNELIWREFYMMILWNFPEVDKPFKRAYQAIVWENNPEHYKRWCEGTTGYPIVDAGMRELAATGFMHNRVRMVTASFLCKHLLLDWRLGEAWFAAHLMDFELSSNNGGWQWAAGTGCDAAPYFRVFNPSEQARKFDPQASYIKRWVPEYGTSTYPQPMVDHAFARQRAITRYKSALSGESVEEKTLFS